MCWKGREKAPFSLPHSVRVPDFVEEQRASAGLLEAPPAHGDRAGEGAFFVPEEFAFKHAGVQGHAVYGNERFLAARRGKVDGARDEFLAGAGFAGDEDRGIGGCHPVQQSVDLLQGATRASMSRMARLRPMIWCLP